MYTCFVCKYVCTTYIHTVPEKCAGSPETGAVDGCQPPCGSWELNPVLVTTEPTLAASFIVLKGKIYSDFFKLMSTCFHLQSKFCCVCGDNSAVLIASCSGHTKQYSTHTLMTVCWLGSVSSWDIVTSPLMNSGPHYLSKVLPLLDTYFFLSFSQV